jgi:hypothetical protein
MQMIKAKAQNRPPDAKPLAPPPSGEKVRYELLCGFKLENSPRIEALFPNRLSLVEILPSLASCDIECFFPRRGFVSGGVRMHAGRTLK